MTMATRRGRRSSHEEEHENNERWLVTYADMITLLMVLFIVMFAISQVDQKKFNALREGMAAGFGQSTSVLDGSRSLLKDPGNFSVEPITPPVYQKAAPELDQIAVQSAVSDAIGKANQRRYAEAAAEVHRLSDVEARLRAALRAHDLEADIRTTIDGRGLTVSLVSQNVVFDANLASLTRRGRSVVDSLAPVLRDLPDDLQVDGHTNQVGDRPKYFQTDWDLSAARAVTVLRRLNEHGRVPAARLSAAAYGQQRPLIDPSRPEARALNKRVDIVIITRLSKQSADLLDLAAHDAAQAEDSNKEGS